VAAWLVFSPVLSARFVDYDDTTLIIQNAGLNPPTWRSTADFWIQPTNGLYTPLAYTLWAGVAKAEYDPAQQAHHALAYHILNLVLHTPAGLAAFLLLKELLPARQTFAACAGAAVFLIHPLQVEPVAWISGMNNLLAGALGLAALWQYLVYAKSVPPSRRHFLFATLLYAAALLSKPTSIVIPLLALILDPRPRRIAVKTVAIWLAMAVPLAIATRLVQTGQPDALPLTQRVWVAVDAMGFYAVKLFAPVNLTIDYLRRPQWLMAHAAEGWHGVVTILIALTLAWKIPWTRAGLAIAAVALLPVLGLVPFAFQDYSTVADRYMYLSLFGIGLAVAQFLARAKGLVPRAVTVCILILLAMRSYDQTQVWHDTGTLARNQLAVEPDSSTGHKFLASWDIAWNQNTDAETECRAAIAAQLREGKTDDTLVWQLYGNLLWQEGRRDEAIQQYEFAADHMVGPSRAIALMNLAAAYIAKGDFPAARQRLQDALTIEPDNAQARRMLKDLPVGSEPPP
jgi:protein O-mannosyl-transferase